MSEKGVEPSYPFGHNILSVARLSSCATPTIDVIISPSLRVCTARIDEDHVAVEHVIRPAIDERFTT